MNELALLFVILILPYAYLCFQYIKSVRRPTREELAARARKSAYTRARSKQASELLHYVVKILCFSDLKIDDQTKMKLIRLEFDSLDNETKDALKYNPTSLIQIPEAMPALQGMSRRETSPTPAPTIRRGRSSTPVRRSKSPKSAKAVSSLSPPLRAAGGGSVSMSMMEQLKDRIKNRMID